MVNTNVATFEEVWTHIMSLALAREWSFNSAPPTAKEIIRARENAVSRYHSSLKFQTRVRLPTKSTKTATIPHLSVFYLALQQEVLADFVFALELVRPQYTVNV